MIKKIFIIKNRLKKDNNFYEIISGSSISFLAKVFGIILGILLNLIIAKYYGAKELGIYSIMSSFFTVVLIFSVFGMNTSVLRFIPEQITKYSYNSAYFLFKKIFKIIIITSIIIGFLIYIFSQSIGNDIFNKNYLVPLFTITAFFVGFQSLGNISIASLRALNKIKLFSFFQILGPLIHILTLGVITFFFYREFNSVYSLIFSYIVIAFVSIYSIFQIFRRNKIISDDVHDIKAKKILAISMPMMLSSVMGLIVAQTDILMLGSMIKAEMVGIYSMAMKFSLLSTFLLTSVNVVIAPKISELFYSNQLLELKMLMKKTVKFINIFSVPVILILIIFGKSILSLFGKEFIIGYEPMLLLLIAQSISIILGPVEFFLNMTGHQKELNYIVILSAFINILLNYFFIPIYGIHGAAFASMISLIILKVSASIYIKNKFNFFIWE